MGRKQLTHKTFLLNLVERALLTVVEALDHVELLRVELEQVENSVCEEEKAVLLIQVVD